MARVGYRLRYMVFHLLLALVAVCAFGDEVRLKNGDRLTGTIVRMDAKEMLLKTEYAGDVKIKRDVVVGVVTSEAVNATVVGKNVLGKVNLADGKAVVEGTEKVQAAAGEVLLFRNAADQKTYLREQRRLEHPTALDFWKGSIDVGYAQARGNAITSTFSSALKAVRATPKDALNVNFFSLYSSNRTEGKEQLTANSIRGGVKYDANLSPQWYAFGSTDLEFDQFQNLDLRFVPAGGFGSHAVKKPSTKWDWFGGGSLNREYFGNGLRRDSGELLVGNDFAHKLNGMFTLTEKVVLYNNISESGQVRVNGDVAVAAILKKWLSWQVAASNRYLSNPLPGRKTNDVLVTTGVRLTFAH